MKLLIRLRQAGAKGTVQRWRRTMTKHIPRKSRWTQLGPNEHRCAAGRVYFRAGQWLAEVHYRVVDPESTAHADLQTWLAGRFKRQRNAMIALEDRVTELKRRHGERVAFVMGL